MMRDWLMGTVASEAIASGEHNFFFDVPPLFSCAPHEGGTTIVFYRLKNLIELSPSVGSAVCTSTGEVGRGAIKVMGPSAVPCRLLRY